MRQPGVAAGFRHVPGAKCPPFLAMVLTVSVPQYPVDKSLLSESSQLHYGTVVRPKAKFCHRVAICVD